MIKIITYREELMHGEPDFISWNQLKYAFNVERILYLESNPDFDPSLVVVFDEEGTIPLAEFEHPENAIYAFGVTATSLMPVFPDAPSVRIEVPTLTPNQGLFGNQAAAIVLYDRERRSWQ